MKAAIRKFLKRNLSLQAVWIGAAIYDLWSQPALQDPMDIIIDDWLAYL